MKEDKTPQMQLTFMKHLNLLIIIYICVVTGLSMQGYIKEHNAATFLNYVVRLPIETWRMTVVCVGYYSCLLILLSFRSRENWTTFCKIILEIFVAILICKEIHFGYAGVILLIMADGIQYVQNIRRRCWIIIAVCVIYLLVDDRFISILYPVISLDTMWMYYEKQMTSVFFVILNILNAVNMFVFITYMIILILDQMSEKKRILSLNEELKVKNEQLLRYAKEMEMVTQTKERNRLAREIHDTLGHALTGIIAGVDACIMLIDVAPDTTKEQLKVIADVARQGIKDVRRSINALRPDALENIELKKALQQMMEETEKTSGAKIDFDCAPDLKYYTKDEEDVIYRIVQESLTNAIRHGKATHIEVAIHKKYNILEIEIQDNGLGCPKIEQGFGLHHMQERLQMLNGQLKYNGENGFYIQAQIPLRWGEEKKDD